MAQLAYGFYMLRDLLNQRVNEVGVENVSSAIQQSVDEHNRQMDALTNLFVKPTTAFKALYETPMAARLQPLQEDGRALPIRVTGRYDVGWPLLQGGAAWGANYVTRTKMTVDEANRVTLSLLSADRRWVRDHLLAALFADTSYQVVDDLHGTINVFGLANNDAVTYNVQTGSDSGSTDTHYYAQSGGITDLANPFPIIWEELNEHPENGNGEIIAFVASNLKASVENLATFTRTFDPNIQPGSSTPTLVGSLTTTVPGRTLGYVDRVWAVEWPSLPAGYIVAVATGGEKPLAMREEPEAELRGFKKVAERNDHPFYESQWLRIAGFGAWNRVGAVIYQVGAANYAVPTGYGVPMP